MSAVILDGKALAASIKKDLTARTSALKASGKVPVDHIIDSEDSDGSLGGKFKRLNLGYSGLEDSSLQVVSYLTVDKVKSGVL